MSNEEKLRYPIGKFAPQESYTQEELSQCIARIGSLPERLDSGFRSIPAHALETPYREGGWNARQVVHHVSDSHMNAYIRFKWTLTEETPLIKAYNEKAWAETPETKLDPVVSLVLLKALHIKWVSLLQLLTPSDLKKKFVHPDTGKQISLERMVALYAWHGDHHLGHLQIIASKLS